MTAVGVSAGDGNGLTGDGRTSGVAEENDVTPSAGLAKRMGWKGVGVEVARGLAVIKYHAVATGCAWADEIPPQPASNMGMAMAIPQAYLRINKPNCVRNNLESIRIVCPPSGLPAQGVG
jgi:hypothetical protein